jgi:thiamine kinase-like enzyme
LEKVFGQELYQIGDFGVWQKVATWLGRLHSRTSPKAIAPLDQPATLLRYDERFYAQWLERALGFLKGVEAGSIEEERRRLLWLAARYWKVVDHLAALPCTLIHGEFYAANVLIQEEAHDLRICPVDWEMAAIAPGLIDLAALAAGDWTDDQRTGLAQAYLNGLAQVGNGPEDLAKLLVSLDYCRIHLAVQWLGWASEWALPAEPARKWLAEAVDLARKLEL